VRLIQSKIKYFLAALLFLAGAVQSFEQSHVHGATLEQRSTQISTSVPAAQAAHTFRFDIMTAGLLGSIEFEYCTNNPFIGTACSAPDGLSVSGANLVQQSGETGFSIDSSSSANRIVLTRVAGVATAQPVNYSFSDVINPSTASQSVYVRISTFASSDATGSRTDIGATVFSTSGGLGAVGYVPPHLTLCVGITVSLNCTVAAGTGIRLGELSVSEPRVATSQFAGATNDMAGYSVTLLGRTMTAGNNVIPALVSPSASRPGTSQFGINLRANSNPAIGDNPIGSGTALVHADYNLPNRFKFQDGSNLTSSSVTTNFNTFTVSYLVNINSNQPPGIYATTATFLATAAF
jgi:hypothetical protein